MWPVQGRWQHVGAACALAGASALSSAAAITCIVKSARCDPGTCRVALTAGAVVIVVGTQVHAIRVYGTRGPPALNLVTARSIEEQLVKEKIVVDPDLASRIDRRERASSADAARLGLNAQATDLEVLGAMLTYVRGFLGKADPALGRTGPVCPFAPKALKLDSIQFAVLRNVPSTPMVEAACLAMKKQFLGFKPQTGNFRFYRAAMLIFPDVALEDAPDVIDATQAKMKELFVQEGYMLGEFHLLNNTPGLRNPNFTPSARPTPAS
eukprot:NODE_826_length_1350_cov_254.144402.p1 GENE.NODE_826_length_1350_cov_254.144402~~NODE_826_length_1350_cov_254.144402.p1  ORF type:complete len:290 (-),score=45.57 NODE_826_length_1350_cov_254.144402:465-1265(-)